MWEPTTSPAFGLAPDVNWPPGGGALRNFCSICRTGVATGSAESAPLVEPTLATCCWLTGVESLLVFAACAPFTTCVPAPWASRFLGGVGSSSVRTPFLMNAGTYGDDAFVAEGTGQTGALSPLPLPLPLAIALV